MISPNESDTTGNAPPSRLSEMSPLDFTDICIILNRIIPKFLITKSGYFLFSWRRDTLFDACRLPPPLVDQACLNRSVRRHPVHCDVPVQVRYILAGPVGKNRVSGHDFLGVLGVFFLIFLFQPKNGRKVGRMTDSSENANGSRSSEDGAIFGEAFGQDENFNSATTLAPRPRPSTGCLSQQD